MNVKLLTTVTFVLLSLMISCRNSGNQTASTQAVDDCLTKEQRQILEDDSLEIAMYEDKANYDDSVDISNGKKALTGADEDNFGSTVNYDTIARPCIDTFKKVMATYGIDELDPRTINLRVPTSLKITLFEGFRGKEMKKFIRQAARNRKGLFGKNKRLAIRVEFGIYTRKVANDLHVPKRYGRICVFLVTKLYEKKKGNKWAVLDNDPDEDADDDAFNFGGIKP